MSLSRKATIRLSVVVVGTCLIIGAAIFVKSQRDEAFERKYRPRMAEILGGAERIGFNSPTTRIEAFRIAKLPEDHNAENASRTHLLLDRYPMQSGPDPVAPELQTRILNVLRTPVSYDWDGDPKACLFVPGVRLRLISGKEMLDLLFCFHCGDLVVFKDGINVAGGDFTPASRQFAAIFKALYPEDAEIQAL